MPQGLILLCYLYALGTTEVVPWYEALFELTGFQGERPSALMPRTSGLGSES